MTRIDIETESSSSDGGLYLQKDATIGTRKIVTPWKSTPIKYQTGEHYPDPSLHKISDIQVELNSTDLEAYRSGEQSEGLTNLQRKLAYSKPSALTIIFIEQNAAEEIEPQDMRTILDIQSEYGDVLTFPLQTPLIETLSPFMNHGELNLNHSPYDAIYPTVRHFIENIDGYEEPVMGVLPLLGWSRRREILREFESAEINFLGLDYRGLKPTKEELFEEHVKLIIDLAKRDVLSNSLLYAFNYKSYHPTGNMSTIQSEEVALTSFGVDILGDCHVYRSAGGDGEITDVKIFNSNNFAYDRIELDSITEQFPGDSTIDPSLLNDFQYKKTSELRTLINSELLATGLRKLRTAIQDGNVREFMRQKPGYHQFQGQAKKIGNRYDDAKGPDVAP